MVLKDCQRLAAELVRGDALEKWRVAEADVRLGATGENVGVFSCHIVPKRASRHPSGLGTTRAMPLDELHALMQNPKSLLIRVFAPTRVT